MSLVLATISDGTEADAADVNQYKTAIETLAGAGWDDTGSGDLDVEELSDEVKAARGGLASLDTRLDVSLNNDGTIKNGAITAQAQINLGDAAATNGDAVRYQELIAEHSAGGLHTGTGWPKFLYHDSSQSAAAHTDAAALPEYDNDVIGTTMVVLRLAVQKVAAFNTIGLRGQYYASSITKEPDIGIAMGGASAQKAMAVASAWTDFDEDDVELDVSGLVNGTTYELTVSIINDGTGTALGKLRYLSVLAYTA